MLSLVELKATALQQGIPGISPEHMLLLFMMILFIPMIPYAFLYVSLLDKGRTSQQKVSFIGKTMAWVHAHRHHELVHHH